VQGNDHNEPVSL